MFGLLLAGVAAHWLNEASSTHRAALAGLVVLTVAQALVFQVQFWRYGPDRGYAFDEAAPAVFDVAASTGASPIYLRDRGDLPGYIEAYWYGALSGMDRSSFVRLAPDEVPPPGAIVLGTDKSCGSCDVLAEEGDYIAYRASSSTAAGLIPNGDFEEIGSTALGVFGAPIFGWSSSSDAALFAGGARTPTAHLVLGNVTDTTTTKQAASSIVAVSGEPALGVQALARAGEDSAITGSRHPCAGRARCGSTVRHVAHDNGRAAGRRRLAVGPDRAGGAGPGEAYANVTCYLEPGGTVGNRGIRRRRGQRRLLNADADDRHVAEQLRTQQFIEQVGAIPAPRPVAADRRDVAECRRESRMTRTELRSFRSSRTGIRFTSRRYLSKR